MADIFQYVDFEIDKVNRTVTYILTGSAVGNVETVEEWRAFISSSATWGGPQYACPELHNSAPDWNVVFTSGS